MRPQVPIFPEEVRSAQRYAGLSLDHTFRKLEQQESRLAGNLRQRNIVVGRVARDVIARVLRDNSIMTTCEETSPTQWKRYCLVTADGVFLQVRFIANRRNYTNLLEDLRSFHRRPHDFYIATTSRDELATLEVIGYASRDELEQRKPRDFAQGVLNRYVPLARLHPFGDLVQELHSRAGSAAKSRVMTL